MSHKDIRYVSKNIRVGYMNNLKKIKLTNHTIYSKVAIAAHSLRITWMIRDSKLIEINID